MDDVYELPKSETQLAEERMAAVERQLQKNVPRGVKRFILCPYCGSWNFPHREFCCDLLRKAVVAVLVADRALKAAAAGEKVANGHIN
jgi:hypothetical protein